MMQIDIDRFFCRMSSNASDPVKFFVGQVMGKIAFNRQIMKICNDAVVTGNGFYDAITYQSFSATMIQLLLDAKHSETVVAKR